jgi:intergrase/recombinase
LAVISLLDWKESFLKEDYAPKYRKQILAKLSLIFKKHTYKSEEMVSVICDTCVIINRNDRCIKLVRLILNYCEEKRLLTVEQLTTCRKGIKNKPSGIDNYVPTDQEVKKTLAQLTPDKRLLYLMYLVSGMRKVEGEYLLTNFPKLKTQQYEGFVKISMNYLRKTKNSYFCYLPLEVYSKLSANCKQLSVRSLEQEIKRKKLIPIKYCRKWFYTKCIELGIPESIADFYEGRTSNGIGSNHYLSKQMLADKNYNKIVNLYNILLK